MQGNDKKANTSASTNILQSYTAERIEVAKVISASQACQILRGGQFCVAYLSACASERYAYPYLVAFV